MTVEKRKFSRIVFDVEAKLTVGEVDYNLDRITNLSIGGCLLAVNDGFAAGQECAVTMVTGEHSTQNENNYPNDSNTVC